MFYEIGDKVRARLTSGVDIIGNIIEINDWGIYGFCTVRDDETHAAYGVELTQIIELIHTAKSRLTCQCGSDKLNHPGHSHWCPKFKG